MDQTSKITIDRITPFNPVRFIGDGWSIWRGPADGNGFDGPEQQCAASLALTEVNVAKITLKTCLMGEETSVHGEEYLQRLKKSTHLILDAKVGQILLQNKHLIPEEWKSKSVYLMGTELRGPDGDRGVIFLFLRNRLRWDWSYMWLNDRFTPHNPAAVIID